MREVQASKLKARLSELLDEIERGEAVVITRRGRRIARIIPEPRPSQAEIDAAIDEIQRLGEAIAKRNGRMGIEEILSLRHEGHEY